MTLSHPAFNKVTLLVPTVDEVSSLEKTCEISLNKVKPEDLDRILILVGKPTTPATRAKAAELAAKYPCISVIEQSIPYLGGALQAGIAATKSSHLVIMSSDLETDPSDLDQLVAAGKQHPDYIIATSRWIENKSIQGYNPIKLVCNWLFQRIMAGMFKTKLTDWTFGYRLMPTSCVSNINWQEQRHAFNLECLLVPLSRGVQAIEIPTHWVPRQEGKSQNSFFLNFIYFRTAFKIWNQRKS
jgi:hypothetical protein